ncbi:MAG: hypothetical protein MK033_07280, partial [Candidatus Caenarcaniphilales bacterium]|nr:hypothetical protein [Candidatus Caenarcaniphilales bacterium]
YLISYWTLITSISFHLLVYFIEGEPTRMESILDSKTNRLQSEFDRLNDEKAALLKNKEYIDDTLITDMFTNNPYAISSQVADPYVAMSVMP